MANLLRLSIYIISLFSAHSIAAALIIDFNSIDNTSNLFNGDSLDIEGYNFSSSIDGNTAILHWGKFHSYNADQGGATYSHNYSGIISSLNKIDGTLFDIHSIDIGDVYNVGISHSYTFKGLDSNGAILFSSDFISDSLPGLETVYLGWNNLKTFTFQRDNLSHLQADNFNLSSTLVPIPAGIYLFLSGLVGLGLMRGRNG